MSVVGANGAKALRRVPEAGAMPDDEYFGDAPTDAGQECDPLRELVPFVPFDDLFLPDKTTKLVIPALGIAPGPPNGYVGQGWVGKTLTVYSAALSVAAGRPVWGLYAAKRGRWLGLDHELGIRHVKRYVTRLIAGMGVEREELRGRMELAIYPRLSLVTPGASDLYARLFEGFDLVTIDPMKGLLPGIDENSSEVRDHLEILSRASEKTGAAVILIHHAGKSPTQGSRPRKESGRGSSAIYDLCQSYFVASAEKGEPIHVSHEKTRELAAPVADFGLRIEDVEVDGNPHGGVRVVHLDRAQLAPPSTGVAEAVRRVVAIIEGKPGCSGRYLRAECKGARATVVDAAVEEAERQGLIENRGAGKAAQYHLRGGAS